jgi:cytochrome c-type biogenesis protein CcmH/NrfG
MKKETLAYAISCTLFGVLIGWIIGSQQASPVSSGPAAAPVNSSASAVPQDGPPPPPPLDVRKAADLEKVAKSQPENAGPRIELANLYYDAQRFDLARPWYEEALRINPKDVNASTDLSVCYYEMNEIDRSLKQLDFSLSIDPTHAKTLLNQGIVRAFGKRDLKGAAESWERVLAVAPNSEEAQRARQGLEGIKSAHGAGGGAGGDRP